MFPFSLIPTNFLNNFTCFNFKKEKTATNNGNISNIEKNTTKKYSPSFFGNNNQCRL